MTGLKFEELNLSAEILDAIKDMGFEEASPIQSEAIPLILQGKDLIGQAQTGTGKTAAFGIPIIEKINPDSKELQAIILCPTRELVIQVAEELKKIIKYKENISVVAIYGGQEIDRQLRALRKGPQIIIGTPGRTMDHMRRGSIKMDTVGIVVLDEADEMLDMGFREDMEIILQDTPKTRQTVLFSATMAQDILYLTGKFQKDPVIVNVANKKRNMPKIQQIYFEVQDKNKPEVLSRLIDLHNVKLALVFCNTKSQVDQLVEILKTRGYFADALHGDMSQNQRDRVMNGFRNGVIEILVATDVAGRGIDVNDVEAVFNFDLPRDDEDYIHRIGRTARAGKSGLAFTFVTGKQVYNLKRIERSNGIQIHRQAIPTIDELEATRINTYSSKVNEIMEAGHISKYINHIEILMGEEYTSLDVAAALLKIIMEKENEGFDHAADFTLPERETMPNRPSRGRFDNRDNFDRKPRNNSGTGFKPFKSEKTRNSDSFKGDRPFRAKKSDADSNNEFNKEDKRFNKSEKTRNSDSFKSDKPFRSSKSNEDKPFRKSDNNKPYDASKSDKPFKAKKSDNDINGEFKKSETKKSFDSSKTDKPFRSSKSNEDKPFRKSANSKNSSFKKSNSSEGNSRKDTKKPGRKFDKK